MKAGETVRLKTTARVAEARRASLSPRSAALALTQEACRPGRPCDHRIWLPISSSTAVAATSLSAIAGRPGGQRRQSKLLQFDKGRGVAQCRRRLERRQLHVRTWGTGWEPGTAAKSAEYQRSFPRLEPAPSSWRGLLQSGRDRGYATAGEEVVDAVPGGGGVHPDPPGVK